MELKYFYLFLLVSVQFIKHNKDIGVHIYYIHISVCVCVCLCMDIYPNMNYICNIFNLMITLSRSNRIGFHYKSLFTYEIHIYTTKLIF